MSIFQPGAFGPRSDPSGAQVLAAGEADALALDFTTNSAWVLDSGTPSNDFSGTPYDLPLVYTSPSLKAVMQGDGEIKYSAHNLFLRSDAPDSHTKQGVTVVESSYSDPLGGNAAHLITESVGTDYHQTYKDPAVITGATYEFSIYAKANGTDYLRLRLGGTPNKSSIFNLANGTVTSEASGTTCSMVDEEDGWWKCKLLWTSTVTGAQTFSAGPNDGSSLTTYAGDTGRSIYTFRYHVRRTPSIDTYLSTTTAGAYALPLEFDTSGASKGLLVEEARTNLLLNNRTLDNASGGWTETNATVTLNNTTGVDGETSYDKIEATAGGACSIARTFTGTAASYTFSAIVQNDDSGWCALGLNDGTTNETKSFNISAGSLGSDGANAPDDSGIEDLGGGNYRVWIVSTLAATTCTATLYVTDGDSESTPDAGEGLYADFLQVELGAFKTSVIETFGSTVTRAADDISLATSAFPHSATVNSGLIEYTPTDASTAMLALSWNDGTANEVVSIGHDASGNIDLDVQDGGAGQTDPLSNGTVTADTNETVGYSWKASDFLLSDNGATAVADTSGTLPTVTGLDIGPTLTGHVRRVLVVPAEKTAAEVEAYGAS